MQPTRRWAQRVQHFTNTLHYRVLTYFLQTKFENSERCLKFKLKVDQSLTAAEIKQVLNDGTRCHDEARTWHHSALSSLAGVGSHSTDQPGGKVHDQVKLAIWSSNVSPENKVEPQVRLSILILSKAYPTKGTLSPLSRHARLLAGEFVSPKSN